MDDPDVMRIFGYLQPADGTELSGDYARYFASTAVDTCPSAGSSVARIAAPASGCSRNVLVGIRGTPRTKRQPARVINVDEIVSLYLENGERFLADLCGSFSLALIEPEKCYALLAIDPMGIERMTYWTDGASLWFSDRADMVARAPCVNAPVADQSIYDFLFFHMIPAPQSIFKGVHKLEPGTALLFKEGKHQTWTYWRPVFTTDGGAREEDLAEELLNALEFGVRATAPDSDTGAFLSGGLDSSTVAGYLSKVTAHPAPTFSIGFGIPKYDELAYARIANQHFGCVGHEYNVTSTDVLAALPLVASSYDEPFGNSSAVPVLHCARLAKQHGINHLLAGDGGDELFAATSDTRTKRSLNCMARYRRCCEIEFSHASLRSFRKTAE